MKKVNSFALRATELYAYVFIVACILTPVQADDAKPASSNLPGAEYPKVHPDGRVTFRLKAADAKKVQLKPGGEGRTWWWLLDNGLGKKPVRHGA